jgi:hypothetical protein
MHVNNVCVDNALSNLDITFPKKKCEKKELLGTLYQVENISS